MHTDRESLGSTQWQPSQFFRVCRLLLRVHITLGFIIFCYNTFILHSSGVRILLYLGWLTGIAGLALFVPGLYTLKKEGRAKNGQSFLFTTQLVDCGIYAVIRHPEYLGSALLVVGSILISQHWSTLILGIPLLVWFIIYVMPAEERHLHEKFGDDYQHYTQTVPSINLVRGIMRLLKKEREQKRR